MYNFYPYRRAEARVCIVVTHMHAHYTHIYYVAMIQEQYYKKVLCISDLPRAQPANVCTFSLHHVAHVLI